MSQQETGKVRLAKEHYPGLWILEAQVSGERGSEDKIADEFRLEDENRTDVRGRVLQHLFLAPGRVREPETGQKRCRDLEP